MLRFDRCELDEAARELRVGGEVVHVEPQVFDVLVHLVHNRDRSVAKTELLDEVWGDRFVSESALTSRIRAARAAIGDDGANQRLIRTTRGHGYRFVGTVEDGDRAVVAEAAPSVTVGARLPALRGRLLGRDEDLARVRTLLDDHRLVTITGPGGAGKTTLAIAAATGRTDDPGFAELAPARDEPSLVRAVAAAAGVEGLRVPGIEPLVDRLARRRQLLVLDNCEHLLDLTATLVEGLLDSAPDVRVLTTSREPFEVDGEVVHLLGALGGDGTELFVERANAVAGGRQRVHADDPQVVELCRRLDGLPLPIELAAAQVRHLRVPDLVERLDGLMGTLSRSRPRAGARHATLTATIRWSHDLLDPAARRLFVRLGVFPAGFDLVTAEAVCGDDDVPVLSVLSDLVAKNLVVHDPETGRYRLLETIRHFAGSELDDTGERDHLVERLRAHVVARARVQPRAMLWLSAEMASTSRVDLENVRMAFEASVAGGHTADAVDVALAVTPMWRNAASYAEGLRWVDRLGELDLDPADELWVHVLSADLGLGSGDSRRLSDAATSTVQLAQVLHEPAAEVIGTICHGTLVVRPERAIERLERACLLAETVGEPALQRLARGFLAVARRLAGEPGDTLAAELQEQIDAASPDGYDRYICLWAAWTCALADGDGDALRRWMDAQMDNVRRSGLQQNWPMLFCHTLTYIAEGRPWQDTLQRARRWAEAEGRDADVDCVLALAYVAARDGDLVEAAELLAATASRLFHDTANYVNHRVIRDLVVRPRLDPAVFDAAEERGQERDLAEVVAAHGL